MKLTSLISMSLIAAVLIMIGWLSWGDNQAYVAKKYRVSMATHTAIPLPTKLIFVSNEKVKWSSKDRDCLARNIYYEAGTESTAGQLAVAQVTHNRLKSGQWGDTICKVVYAKHQFSWTTDPKKRHVRPHGPLWKKSQLVAADYMNGYRITRLQNSLHYHAEYVSPAWGKEQHRVKQIGAHIFYDLSRVTVVANKQQSKKVDR